MKGFTDRLIITRLGSRNTTLQKLTLDNNIITSTGIGVLVETISRNCASYSIPPTIHETVRYYAQAAGCRKWNVWGTGIAFSL
jgi:hypothetical protein